MKNTIKIGPRLGLALGIVLQASHGMEEPKTEFQNLPTECLLEISKYCAGNLNHLELVSTDLAPYAIDVTYHIKVKPKHKVTREQFSKFPYLISLDLSPLGNIYGTIVATDAIVVTNESLSGLTNLTHINLCGNKTITDIGLQGLTNLTDLNLSFNEIITDNSIVLLTKLIKLDLDFNNKITDSGLNKLTNIVYLRLRSNYLITGGTLHNLKKLNHLDLEGNNLIRDNDLQKLTNLKRLDLRFNKDITNNGIEGLTNLTTLDFTLNNTIDWDIVFKLPKLTTFSDSPSQNHMIETWKLAKQLQENIYK